VTIYQNCLGARTKCIAALSTIHVATAQRRDILPPTLPPLRAITGWTASTFGLVYEQSVLAAYARRIKADLGDAASFPTALYGRVSRRNAPPLSALALARGRNDAPVQFCVRSEYQPETTSGFRVEAFSQTVDKESLGADYANRQL